MTRLGLVLRKRFEAMHRLVDSPPLDLPVDQWPELHALVVEFSPDLVIELGRGWGNSTCVFTEAANALDCRVVSVGFDSERGWESRSAPRLEELLGPDWFAPLTVLNDDITTLDFRPVVADSSRALVFWDAHGEDVAKAVLERLLPLLPAQNKVVVDDIWTTRQKYGLDAEYQAGPLWSLFDELPCLWDYLDTKAAEFEAGDRWISFTARR